MTEWDGEVSLEVRKADAGFVTPFAVWKWCRY